jgi:nucleoside-diphosphate-sugar epimerase
MDDAIDATIKIMDAAPEKIKIRSSYNLAAISFTPEEIANQIQKFVPEFKISYNSDFRQKIADSWPKSIDDSKAREDWGWKHNFDLQKMSEKMLINLQEKYNVL